MLFALAIAHAKHSRLCASFRLLQKSRTQATQVTNHKARLAEKTTCNSGRNKCNAPGFESYNSFTKSPWLTPKPQKAPNAESSAGKADIDLWKGGTCCSKGAMPGTNSMAVNSMVPSTLKCECVRGSRNSLKVCLKKASYSSLLTCRRNLES